MEYILIFIKRVTSEVIRLQGQDNLSIYLMLILFVFITITTMYLAMIIQTIIHEIGHLIFGTIVGCKVLSIRIGTFAMTLDIDGVISLKRQRIIGSGGQCLLGPPKENKRAYCILIAAGGIAFNILVTYIVFMVMVFIKSYTLKWTMFVFCFVGVVQVVFNTIPQSNHIVNDGRFIWLMLSDKNSYTCYYKNLEVTQYLLVGSYKSIPYNVLDYDRSLDISNDLVGYMLLFNYYFLLDNREFEKAKLYLSRFRICESRISHALMKDILLEELYIELKTNLNSNKINRLINNQVLKDKFKEFRSDINVYRVKCAYEEYINKEKKIDRNILDRLKKNYVLPGEIMFNLQLIDSGLHI